MIRSLFTASALAGLLFAPTTALPLTTEQFLTICETAPGHCVEHGVLNAYIGGALDLLATLDEQTPYLETLYCHSPQLLFDVEAIIDFMKAHRDGYEDRNAMLLLVRYFEAHGGCPDDA